MDPFCLYVAVEMPTERTIPNFETSSSCCILSARVSDAISSSTLVDTRLQQRLAVRDKLVERRVVRVDVAIGCDRGERSEVCLRSQLNEFKEDEVGVACVLDS